MSFSRIKVVKNENYTVINNTCVKDVRLSLKAKGLFVTVMSLPPTWDFSIRGIVAIVKEGETAVYSGIKELIDYGYVHRFYINENGRRIGVEYVFNEMPNCEILNVENPNLGIPNLENPNDNILSTKEIKYSSNKIKKEEYIYKKSENFENSNTSEFESNFSKTKKEKDVSFLKAKKESEPMKDGLHFSKKTNNETNNEQIAPAKPAFISENRTTLIAPDKPKYDFDLIRNLPSDRGANQKIKNAFETKMKKSGFLTNTFSAEIINPHFTDFWNKYILELEKDVSEGKDIGLADTLHIINNFPIWFASKTQGKEVSKSYKAQNYNGQYKPTDTVLNNKKPEAKRGSFVTPKPLNIETNQNQTPAKDFNMFGLPNKPKQETTQTNQIVNDKVINEYLISLARDRFNQEADGLIKASYWLIDLGIDIEMQGKKVIFKIEKISDLHHEIINQMQDKLGTFTYQIQ